MLWVVEIAGDEWRLAGTDRPDQEKHPSLTVSQCLNKRGLDQLQSLITNQRCPFYPFTVSVLWLGSSPIDNAPVGPEKNFVLIVNFLSEKLSVIV